MKRLRAAILLLATLAAPLLRADEPAPPNYAAAFLGTTAAYRPPGGPFDGLQHDVTLLAGYGRYVSKTVALELDLGPTWVKGRYASFSLVPGVVWTINPYVYAAARFVVPVDPEAKLVLFPGLGLSRTFGRTTPILEVNLSSTIGKGKPDFGIAVTAGVLVGF